MKHVKADVEEHALAQQPRLRTHRRVAIARTLDAALVAEAHLVPQADGGGKGRRLAVAHRQRAVRKAPRLFDLHEIDRFAQRFHDAEALCRADRQAVELGELARKLYLGGGDVGERHVLEPGTAACRVGKFRRGGLGELGKPHGAAA